MKNFLPNKFYTTTLVVVLVCTHAFVLGGSLARLDDSIMIDSYNSSTFKSECNNDKESLLINSDDLVYLENESNKWSLSASSMATTVTSTCKLSFVRGRGQPESFLLRIDLRSKVCSSWTQSKRRITFKIVECSIDMNDCVQLAKQTNFDLIFNELDNMDNNSEQKQLEAIETLTLTPVRQSQSLPCKSDEFKCNEPKEICMNQLFRCDDIDSCPDDTDESNCNNKLAISIVKPSSIDSTANEASGTTYSTKSASDSVQTTSDCIDCVTSTTTKNSSNQTDQIDLQQSNKTTGSSIGLVIGIIVLVAFVSLFIIGALMYGRRKRKWREFLAQLDSNTDWEYEQLDDDQAIYNSRVSVFRVNTNSNIS